LRFIFVKAGDVRDGPVDPGALPAAHSPFELIALIAQPAGNDPISSARADDIAAKAVSAVVPISAASSDLSCIMNPKSEMM
jgi:hypothetical protein